MKFAKKVKLLWGSMKFTYGIRRSLLNALALIYFLSLGFNLVAITTLFAISTIIMTFFEFPTGAIADYDSRKKSLMISFFLFFIGFLGIFLFKSFWLIAIFWILTHIAYTFSTGADTAWYVDALKASKNKSILLKFAKIGTVSESFGQIIGGIIGFLIVAINFRFIWLVISLTSLLMVIIISKYMEERNFKQEKTSHNYLKKVLIKARESISYILHQDNRELRVLLLGSFIGIISMSTFFIALPLYLTQTLGLDQKYLPIIFSILTVFTLIAPFLAEKIAIKKSFRISLFFICIITGISMILFGFPKILIIALIFLAVIKLADSMNGIIRNCATEMEFSSKIRASLGSISSIKWAIADSIAVFLAGIGISTIGIIPVIVICAILAFITAIIYLIGLKK
ncbi:MAG: MFS transporter [archaeon]